ncbi:MAG: GntR family transcriptional regulator [Actinomycetes bacterium]
MTEEPLGGLAAARVADVLRQEITEGRHRPGSALREAHIAARLAVSRNTVREAFRLLGYDNLVEHVRNRGVTVRELSEDDVADIYAVRRTLEQMGLRAAEANPPMHGGELADVVQEAEEAAAAGDWARVATADLRFHQAIVGWLGSERVDRFFARIVAELRLAFATMPDPEDLHAPYVARNRQLAELVRAGETAAGAAELEAYLSDAQREITRVIRLRSR